MNVQGDIAIPDIKELQVLHQFPVVMRKRKRVHLLRRKQCRSHNEDITLKIRIHQSASICHEIYVLNQIPRIDPTAIPAQIPQVVQGTDTPGTTVTTTPSESAEKPIMPTITLVSQWTPQVRSQPLSCTGIPLGPYRVGVIPASDDQCEMI